jgi:serine phosphatase RsbU (regulator of sigma subunit)
VDCTGHGVPGALVSVIGFNALNSAIKEFKINDPGAILDKTRELVVQTFNATGGLKDGMDMSLISFQGKSQNSKERVIKWAGANNPLWVLRKDATDIEEYKANKQPIGFTDSPQPFTTHEVVLNPGDTVYIFTDGYADQFGGDKGKKLKSGSMKKLLVDIQKLSMDKQKEVVHEEFKKWKSSLEQVDDVCVIGIRI